jgi:hypothetical protein
MVPLADTLASVEAQHGIAAEQIAADHSASAGVARWPPPLAAGEDEDRDELRGLGFDVDDGA